jgi:hypothetical protein
MLGLQVHVQVDEICVVPTPQNILNEMDGITRPFGVVRYTGERGRYYKDHAHQIASIAYESPEQQHMLLGLELRAPREFAVFENTDLSSMIHKIDVLDGHKLRVTSYEAGAGTALYSDSTSTYDLLDRTQYPFLEEVLAHATRNISGLRAYLSPLGHGRYNHILPYHLAPVQQNYRYEVQAFQQATSFYLNDRYLIPDSIEFNPGTMPEEDASNVRFVNGTAAITNPGDIYVNFWTGEIKAGSDFSKYESFLSYQVVDPVYRFMTTPGSTIFSLASTDVATRLNTYDDPNCTLKKHRYQEAASNILEGYSYSGSKVSPKLAFMFQEGTLHQNNLNRWG